MKRTLFLLLLPLLLLSCEKEPATVAVTGIKVSPDRLDLTAGESASLSAAVSPSDATDKTVLWSSSDASVASVSDGTVTALQPGSAEIRATTRDGGHQAVCKVTVEDRLRMDPGQDLAPVFDEKGGTATVSFTAAGPWTASIPGDRIDWVGLDPAQGNAGPATLRLNIAENTTFEARTASVRIQCGDAFETVVVSQKQKDDLTVTASRFEVGSEGGTVSIEVKANVDYTWRVEGDWIRSMTTRAYQKTGLLFEIAPNEDVKRREGAVIFTGGGFSETVRIFQEGETPSLLLTSDNTITFGCGGGSFSVDVRSNVDVAVEMPSDAPWVRNVTTRSMSSHRFQFEVEANPGYDEREARILFSNRDNGLSEAFTVREEQKDAIVPQDKDMVIPEKGGVFEVNLSSNVEFRFTVEGDWIREVPGTRGMTGSTLRFEADPLPEDTFCRDAKIVFSDPEQTVWNAVFLHQNEESPLISFKDPAVKGICVREWDRNRDGELSRREAAAVKDLGRNFSMSGITSFEELVFFTGLTSLHEFCFWYCTNLKTVTFPEGLKTIGNAAFACSGLAGQLHLPEGLTAIGASAFTSCSGLTGDLVIPEGIQALEDDTFGGCSGFSGDLILPEGLRSIGNWTFDGCGFSRIILQSKDIPNCGEGAFAYTGDGLIYVPTGMAAAYQETPGWKTYRLRITEEGRQPKDFFYCSTDFSRDGEVVCLQKATKGKGIPIIFLGDGYLDRDMAPGGRYETLMRQWMEQLFVYEPYRSFRDWFSIYTVKVVSKQDVFFFPGSERKLTWDDTEPSGLYDSYIVHLPSVAKEYAARVPVPDGMPLKIAVLMNTDEPLPSRSFCQISNNGFCCAWCYHPFSVDPTLVNHELGGHGIAWLADEYDEHSYAPDNPQGYVEHYQAWGSNLNVDWGAYMNIDWRSDPSTVRWSRFLQDPRYADEGLGVFEGAFYIYGLYRSTLNSMMGHHSEEGAVFNAPSREAIYRMIMRLGVGEDWTYDYEEFVKADEAGRKQAAEAYAAHPPTRTSVLRNDFVPDLPPVITDGPVREIRVSRDGKVTLVR